MHGVVIYFLRFRLEEDVFNLNVYLFYLSSFFGSFFRGVFETHKSMAMF